jgi:1,4-dihydroxy-6-naphthoate synthase
LNRRAFEGAIDVTKLSYHAYAHLLHQYKLLDAGSALGNNCGPLLVAAKPLGLEEINRGRIAIPGKMTTANFLLGLFYPDALNKTEVLFSDIEDAVLDGRFDAGLIIHENRFTYEQKGLVRLADLGEKWEQSTHTPIPLGGIVVNRRLPAEVQQKVNRALRRSVEYAFANTPDVMPYVRAHAQAMDESVMLAHINLYVNQYSISLGEAGRSAVLQLFERAHRLGLIPAYENNFFVT